MEEVELPPSSVVGHEYFQHDCSKWHDEHLIPYQSYFIRENYDLPNRKAFGSGGSTPLKAEMQFMSVEKGPDQQVGASNERPRGINGFCRLLECKSSALDMFTFMLEAEYISKDELATT